MEAGVRSLWGSNSSRGRYYRLITSTALQTAVFQENLELVQFLLEAGAIVDTYGYGHTALQVAVKHNNTHLTRLLLAYGANVHAPAHWPSARTALQAASENGATALQAAARSKNPDMVILVLAAGASTNTLSGTDSALAIAIRNDDLPMFELLLHHAVDICFNFADNIHPVLQADKIYPVLQLAAKHRSTIFLRRLIDVGLDVNEFWEHGLYGNALQRAVADGHLKAAQLLLEVRADPDAAVPSGCAVVDWLSSALFVAVSRRTPRLVKLFLEYEANPNYFHPKEDKTPLAYAIEYLCIRDYMVYFGEYPGEEEAEDVARYQKEEPVSKELKIILLLLDSDADPNCQSDLYYYGGADYARSSILGFAATEGLIDIVKMLLTAGASPNWRYSVDDGTALGCAIYGGSNQIIHLLLEAGADVNAPACPNRDRGTALQQAVSQLNLDCIRDLIHRGADVNALPAGIDGMTALQMAVRVENDEIVHLILDAGADINAPACPVDGRTALQEAASKGNLANVRMLLQKGADVNAPPSGKTGVTALQAASINGYLAVAMLLLHNGADINADPSEIEGRTALQGAAEHGRLDIVHLLLENDDEMEGFYDRCEVAAEFADEEGHTTIARILREYRKDETC